MTYRPRGPAVERLEWILAGLDGTDGWGGDAADVLAPELTAILPAGALVERIRLRVATYAPVTVIGVATDSDGTTARARIRRRDGTVDVVTCVVEPEAPHRITATWTTGLEPTDLTARLPMDFADYPLPDHGGLLVGAGNRLVVFSGVPGSGKSTLADAAGKALGVPVFAGDWLLGALTPYGGRHLDRLIDVGAELLTTLAVRQLALGQSAILDMPVEDPATRDRWRSLAQRAGAAFRVVVCVCSDPEIHRARVEGRSRAIPGWPDAGDWPDVVRRLAAFVPWPGDVLIIDTVEALDVNVGAVLEFLRKEP